LLQTGDEFTGHGQSKRSGKLVAQITVRVDGISPTGQLSVFGTQVVEINHERQEIKVAGELRPEDIGDRNTVQSNKLANATISYTGQGELGNHLEPSWWQRFLVWAGI
jgi:flagellar L-ring protein precursor FlgH